MAFWWVNHKQSWKAETGRGILWAPLATANGREYPPYSNMRLAQAGDIVFSYAGSQIGHVGVVDAEAFPSLKPDYASKAPWANEGLLLPVTFSELAQPIVPKQHLDVIRPLLAEKYAPIQDNGNGNLSYLSSISDELGARLLEIGGVSPQAIQTTGSSDSVAEDIQRIVADASLRPTDKMQLSKARIGQGLFRKSVLALEPACRVTGVTIVSLLRASHIKPWRESTNSERLDGANGLMLAPHIDLLFDKFLVSFTDDGNLLLSRRLDKTVREKWHLANSANPKPFNQAQRAYLATHRARLS
ncbi:MULTISPECIES: HNH endonuclease [Luteibacter]|uniref:HNH endonuclease n=1 Tax=Luteibacter TaxID=242605 RepID=UPI0012E09A8A|nr:MULTISPECIES: HNH endonuclease [unclassified Luteibacter]